MKHTNQYLLLAACALGVLAGSPKLLAADAPTPSLMPGCCAGMATEVADKVSTNAVPDLLTTCPVSGEKLGGMGAAYTFTYKDQEVKLCCKGCKKDFDKDPAKYMKLIRAADKTEKAAKVEKK